MTLFPMADSYVQNTTPFADYGTQKYMKVSNSTDAKVGVALAYLKFNVSRIMDEVDLTQLQYIELKVYVRVFGTMQPSAGKIEWYVGEDNWQEDAITWTNKPSYSSMGGTISDEIRDAEKLLSVRPSVQWSDRQVLEGKRARGEKTLTLVLALKPDYAFQGYVQLNSREDPFSDTPSLTVHYFKQEPLPPAGLIDQIIGLIQAVISSILGVAAVGIGSAYVLAAFVVWLGFMYGLYLVFVKPILKRTTPKRSLEEMAEMEMEIDKIDRELHPDEYLVHSLGVPGLSLEERHGLEERKSKLRDEWWAAEDAKEAELKGRKWSKDGVEKIRKELQDIDEEERKEEEEKERARARGGIHIVGPQWIAKRKVKKRWLKKELEIAEGKEKGS